MTPSSTYTAIIIMTALGLASCSTTKDVHQNNSVNNTLAEKAGAAHYTELSFEHNSAALDTDDQHALRALVTDSMKNGSIEEIKVISWADREYPAASKKTLSAKQRSLADRRNQSIQEYLTQNYPSVDIEVYNMAKKPNAIQDLFKTSDARVKQAIQESGAVSGKSSKALILSVMKE